MLYQDMEPEAGEVHQLLVVSAADFVNHITESLSTKR